MSGFAGVIRLDDAVVASDTVARLASVVAHRGPDAHGAWCDQGVAFAHAMLRTTPESASETQPLVDRELVLVADARLDNRDELTRALDLDRTASDAAFIVAAYRKWGSDCARHLEGDFAFAIWNRDTRTLFIARDAIGVKSLVYAHVPGKLFAFASEVRGVLVHPEVSRAFDESRIAAFLSIYFEDKERTFYRDVKRLPNGSTLTLRDARLAINTWWSPRDARPLKLKDDAAYAEGFREHFVRAVRDSMRARSEAEVGAMLSGGLDSSSIVCVARDQRSQPLPTFSWIFSDAMEADEREYQRAVIDAGGVHAIALDSAELDTSPWNDIDALLPDGPVYAPNFYLNTIAAKRARAMGLRVLLDGLGGDLTISRGSGRLAELLFRGRFLALKRELNALRLRRGKNESLASLFLRQVVAPFVPPPLMQLSKRVRGRRVDDATTLLSARLAPLMRVHRWESRWYTSGRDEHMQQFESPLINEGLELYDRLMAHFGIEGRYPFFAKHLVEYCLSLPSDQKLADGYTRIVARRALEGVVPKKVLWRAGKGAPGLHVLPILRKTKEQMDASLSRDFEVLAPYVNVDALRRTYETMYAERAIELHTVFRLWSAAVLGRWLQRQEKDLVPASVHG